MDIDATNHFNLRTKKELQVTELDITFRKSWLELEKAQNLYLIITILIIFGGLELRIFPPQLG